MYDAVLDEEVKKKKRRVLIVLLVLLLGTAGALPFVEVTGTPSAAAPESTPEPPTHTAEPTNTPQLPTYESTREAVETTAPTATSQPTAPPTPIPVPPTATEELPGGAGGGEPEASPTPTDVPTSEPTVTEESLDGAGVGEMEASSTPTGVPTDTPVPPMPTPEAPEELPVTGAGVCRSRRLALGLTAFSVGALMLAVGFALRREEMPAAMSQPEPITAAAQSAQEGPERPSDVGAGAGTQVWLTLGLAAVVLVLVFVAGYTLRKTKRQ
jgi:cytoskeletal protein RodZ